MKRAIVLLGFACVACLFGAVGARAQAYKWIDEQGATHWVDSLEKIPERYRGTSPPKHLIPHRPSEPGGQRQAVELWALWESSTVIYRGRSWQEEVDEKWARLAIFPTADACEDAKWAAIQDARAATAHRHGKRKGEMTAQGADRIGGADLELQFDDGARSTVKRRFKCDRSLDPGWK